MKYLPDPNMIDMYSFLWGAGYAILCVAAFAWYGWMVYTVVYKK
jgi:hypothetical protein